MQIRAHCTNESSTLKGAEAGRWTDKTLTLGVDSELREPCIGVVQNLNIIPSEKRQKELECCPPLSGFPELA